MALKVLGESRQIRSNKKHETDKAINHAVISRTNATLFDMAFSLAQDGKNFAWSEKNFKPDSLINHCKELVKIDSGREAFMDMYKEFKSIADIELFLEEENNDSIARSLALCKRFNFNLTSIKAAVQLISSFVDPSAKIVLTTAHKSKGQEWDKVTLCDDFNDAIQREKRNGNGTKHEWNLLYVALTRAKKELSLLDSIKLLLGVLTTEENLELSIEQH
jgi:superfamily I DNA/RNA helicase